MADKIVVLQAGVVEQVGSPMELYLRPANKFVAGFIGSPKMNFIEDDSAHKFGAHTIGIRPEHFELSKESGTWRGKVGVMEHLGSDTFLRVEVAGIGQLTVRADGNCPLKYGEETYLSVAQKYVHSFDENGLAMVETDA